MKINKIVAIAFILGTVSAGALSAQTRPGSQPAEFPPTSYQGKQYVDSKGCVFIRAGIDGDVSWVPRVSRTRNGVCGFRPTFANQVTEPAPAPVQTAEVIKIEPKPAPVAAAATPAPKPAPRRVAKAAPKPKPKPAPKVMRQQAAAPRIVEKEVQPVPQVVRTAQAPLQGEAACRGASPLSSQYLRSGKHAVRCGPQASQIVGTRISTAPAPRAAAPVAVASRAVAQPQPQRVSPHRRIVPRHVAVNRVNTNNVKVPHGYEPVWTDGRLNPKRAEQSLAGHKSMNLIWTSTVPRRLINQADGRDVTASVPLVFPFTDYERQQRELGQVTIVKRNGQTLKRILRSVTNAVHPNPGQAGVETVARQPVYSSRSAAPKAAPKATAKRAQPKVEVAARGFVQVGKFSDKAAAHRMAKKVQRMGLPVRVGVYTRNGQQNRLVIAGPFGGEREVNRAIKRLRSAGYNAVAR